MSRCKLKRRDDWFCRRKWLWEINHVKIITGVLTPTSGSMVINGKISALLELGSGFNPEYSGYENIFLNGMVLGFPRRDGRACPRCH